MMERTRLQRFLILIWPTIYRAINSALYFLLNLIRSTIKFGIEQIKNNG